MVMTLLYGTEQRKTPDRAQDCYLRCMFPLLQRGPGPFAEGLNPAKLLYGIYLFLRINFMTLTMLRQSSRSSNETISVFKFGQVIW